MAPSFLKAHSQPAFPRPPAKKRGLMTGVVGLRSKVGFTFAMSLVWSVRILTPLAFARIMYLVAIGGCLGVSLNAGLLSNVVDTKIPNLDNLPVAVVLFNIFDAWAVTEVFFFFYSLYRARRLGRRRLQLPFPLHEREYCVNRITKNLAQANLKSGCVDPTDGSKLVPGKCTPDCPHTLLRGWIRGSEWNKCSVLHVKSWLCWALFSCDGYHELSSYQQNEIESVITEIKAETGIVFPEATTTADLLRSVQKNEGPIRLTLDKMVWLHRPLIAYLVTDFIMGQILFRSSMYLLGFKILEDRIGDQADVKHWYRPASKTSNGVSINTENTVSACCCCNSNSLQIIEKGAPADDTSEPEPESNSNGVTKTGADGILFLHGLGIGPLIYLSLIKSIYAAFDGALPMLITEIPYIALRTFKSPDIRGPDASAEAMVTAMRAVNMERAVVVSHSFGTVVTSWILRHSKEHVHSVVLVDPVCLQLARADVAFAAIHRKPLTGIDTLLEYFVFREINTAATLARNFIWHRNVIWASELPKGRSIAVLSEDDVIVPARAVKIYLEEEGVEVVWFEGLGHAEFLGSNERIGDITAAVKKVAAVEVY